MDAILYIQAAREELNDRLVNETIDEAKKASFISDDLDYGAPV